MEPAGETLRSSIIFRFRTEGSEENFLFKTINSADLENATLSSLLFLLHVEISRENSLFLPSIVLFLNIYHIFLNCFFKLL